MEEVNLVIFRTVKPKHLHKCPNCGKIYKAINFHGVDLWKQILWTIGWSKKRWHLVWVCPNCGSRNNTHEID